jgi:hypothetical protein
MTSGRLKVALSHSNVQGPCSLGSRADCSMACSVRDVEFMGRVGEAMRMGSQEGGARSVRQEQGEGLV